MPLPSDLSFMADGARIEPAAAHENHVGSDTRYPAESAPALNEPRAFCPDHISILLR